MGQKYRHLIEQIVCDNTMRIAWQRTARGRRMTCGALAFKEFAEHNLSRLAFELHTGAYQPGATNSFYVFEPKPRLITALPFRDRVAQHAVCHVIEPIFEKTFLPRSFACRIGKGTHAGVIALQSDLRRMEKAGPVYALKTDFSRFFPSIDRAALHAMIAKKISCAGTLRVLRQMVPPTGIGLPIGSLTSQLFAGVYATALDRHLQQALGEKVWFRYMDDVVVLGHCPVHLHALRREMERFSAEHLFLRFSKWSVQPAGRGINFLGYRIWSTHKLLRRQSVTRAKRKIAWLRRIGDQPRLNAFLAAWIGHAGWADTQNLMRHLSLLEAKP